MRSPRARLLLSCALAVALLASACTDGAKPLAGASRERDRDRDRDRDGRRRPAPATELDWRDCGGGECAELEVPRDYDDPSGPTIEIALIRLPATDPDERIGSLLVNPGGPGASGVEFVRGSSFIWPDELRERFDIVGWDPRGTGGSVPVTCTDSLDEVLALDYSPESADERTRLDAGIRELTAGCQERSGDVLPYIASQDTVRDMDRIREAVGDSQLTYLGYSYGTYLGALYADFFPDRVRALVLDGAVDPELSALDVNLQQAAGFEHALQAFLDDCAADEGCEFHNDGDPARAYDDLVARVDGQPLPAGDGRTLGPNELDLGVAQSLYLGEFGWGDLAAALDEAATDGDGGALLELSDEYTGRLEDGTYEGLLEPFWAIGCVDGPSLGAAETYPSLEDEFRAAAPRFGITFLYSALVCTYWPVPPAPDPGPLDAPGAPPILVVGTTGDPATPYQWAESLAGVLGSGVLLTAEGEQHTSFLVDDCVTDRGVRYLVDLEAPDEGTRCGT